MNIIIVGCGKVGEALAEQLNEEGNNITVIDITAAKVHAVAAKYDVMGIVGNGATHLVQQEAGIKHAHLLIAVTGSDELNLLCCLIAKKEGNCQTIARVRSPQYSREAPYLKDELGLAMVINPEMAAAAEIARVLRFPSAMRIDTFATGRVEMIKFRLPDGSLLAGMSVKDIAVKLKCDVLICTVERGDDAFIANGDLVFEQRDVISLIAPTKNAIEFFKKIDYKINSVKDVMIVGGGGIAHYLCEILTRSGSVKIKLIEKDEARCEKLSCELSDVTTRMFITDIQLLYAVYNKQVTDTTQCEVYRADRLIALGLLDSAMKSMTIGSHTGSQTQRYIQTNKFGATFCELGK